MRLDQLTSRLDPKAKQSFIAIIRDNGTVDVLSSTVDDMRFQSEEIYRQWAKYFGLSRDLQLIEINSQGKMPPIS